MPKLIIVRGLPGSGKSTYAKNLEDVTHYEADMFFAKWPHDYLYDQRLIGVAHDWCYSNVVRSLWQGNDVVVSNTFTKMWELDRYLGIPIIVEGVEIEVVEMRTQFENIHGVPENKLQSMRDRWESIPEEWIEDGLKVEIVL